MKKIKATELAGSLKRYAKKYVPLKEIRDEMQKKITEDKLREEFPESERMMIATLHNGTKIYDVDMDAFGWIDDEDTEPADAQISKEDGEWPVLSYWDGNNWRLDFLQAEPEEVKFEMAGVQPEKPEPEYYEAKRIHIGEGWEEIEIVQSNTSGSITPYWAEMPY